MSYDKYVGAFAYIGAKHDRLVHAAAQLFEHPYKPVALDHLRKVLTDDPRIGGPIPLSDKDRETINDLMTRDPGSAEVGRAQADKETQGEGEQP